MRYINADALEAAIWAEIERVLTNPAFLRQALTMNSEETLERLPQLEAQAARLEDQIAEAEKKERRALELALSLPGMPMDTLREMVAEIQQAKRGWQEEHDRLTWRMAELTATAERLRDVDEQINAIMASVRAHAYEQDWRAILKLLIERILVEYDGTEGRYAAEIDGVLPMESLVSSVSTVVTAVGATVQLNAAVSDYPACQNFGKGQDITVRNSLIERGIGEGIYIAGTYTFTRYGGCPTYGNTHRDILIGGNTVREPGSNGEQGDGIDLEGGLLNVTARRNVIQNACAPGAGPGKGRRWHHGGRRVPAGASELPL